MIKQINISVQENDVTRAKAEQRVSSGACALSLASNIHIYKDTNDISKPLLTIGVVNR